MTRPLWRKFAGSLTLAALSACASNAQAPQPDTPRGIRWTATAPVGIDASALDAIYAQAEHDEHRNLKGIVIVRDGRLVSEHYFNGDTAGTLHDIRSATKSITSLLMGIAIAQGKVRGVEASIADYLPSMPPDGKEKIRIQDLLNMRSGLDADDDDPKSPGNEDRLDESTDWIHTLYGLPMKRQPGTQYLYCSANAFLTGAIVENATHQPLDQFAQKNLFAPLGIRDFHWRHVPVNRTTGQGNLEITARDMASIGEMVRNGGTVAGRSVVPKHWIETSIASQVTISNTDPFADSYGYMWYTRAEPVNGTTITVHFASGNGGNKIYIVPSLHMVVAISSSAYGTNYGQRRSQDILLKILAASSERPSPR